MIDVKDKAKCTGCTACASICPNKCIAMQEDEEGFRYPIVDKKNCFHCDKCDRVCPYNTLTQSPDNDREAYVVRSKNTEYLMNGTSGGFVGPLIDHVIESGGISCAATMDDDMSVKHVLVKNKEEWKKSKERIQGSKYVQSDLNGIFGNIKELLNEKKVVLFIGTPCQVNGLSNFIGEKNRDRLILIDIVCHGVPSHLLWDIYKEYQEKKYASKIVGAWFRKKTYGYNGSTMTLKFMNGKIYNGFLRTDMMLKAYYGNIATRYSCFECPAKGEKRSSDITIFDSWHAKMMSSDTMDDNKGYTNVIINSLNGKNVWESIREDYFYYKIDSNDAIINDGIMYSKSSSPSKGRDQFYVDLKNLGIQSAMKRFMPVTLNDRLRVSIKKIVMKKKG